MTQISEMQSVKNVFGTMQEIGVTVEVNGQEKVIDLVSYDDYMFEETKESVASGDLSKVYGDSNYALTIFSDDSKFDVGDIVKIGDNEIEISCVASFGIGSVSGGAVIICSEETFMRLTGESGYMMINVILQKDASEVDVNKIQSLAGDDLFTDRREEDKVVYGSYWVVRVAAYGFIGIIAFITVLNIMNNISMGVSARIKQYGAMRAVGMESRQVTKMIIGESATYTLCGTIVGIVIGLLLHYLIYLKLIATHFGGAWKIPIPIIAIILLLVSVSCAVAVYAPAKRIRNMSITATINEL